MNVAFVLPCSGRYPIGGFRIVYEHANRLAERGYIVTILHATNPDALSLSGIKKIKNYLLFLRNKITGMYKPYTWFHLKKGIKTVCCLSATLPRSHRFDVAVATAWQTAGPVARSNARQKFYLVQHFETWDHDARTVIESWKLPLRKIAISRWLQQLIEKRGELCDLVPNAVDTDFFHPKERIEDRDPFSLLIQLHHKDWKGSLDALSAVKILRERGRSLTLHLFGIPDEKDFPVERPYVYHRNLTQSRLRDLYGRVAIFVAASWSEGWGLTPHEAAACGAAIVATDIDGHREFLEPGVSALMSSPKDPHALADHIERLLLDQDLRQRIARAGLVAARRFDWTKAAACFEQVINSAGANPIMPDRHEHD